MLSALAMDLAAEILGAIFGVFPTNLHPAGAFLYNLGIESLVLTMVLHFLYGSLWGLVFVFSVDEKITLQKSLFMSLALWLFMMMIYSPIIGWGFFGFGYAEYLSPEHPLHLSSPYIYILFTFSGHIAYGLTLGILTKRFVSEKKAWV